MNHLRTKILSLLMALLLLVGASFALFSPQSSPSFVSAQADSAFKTLKKGSGGEEVRRAQQALYDLGYYEGPVTSNFSKAFEQAVKAFQQDFSLKVTGELNEETYLLITADLPSSLPQGTKAPEKAPDKDTPFVQRGEWYSDKEHVAAYLLAFGELPENYLTKREAEKLGWDSRQGNLWKVAPGMSIGGDKFGNYEGILPAKKGRQYYECDIDFEGKYRNEKRIVFSNDGLVFYTQDHYETFEEIKK